MIIQYIINPKTGRKIKVKIATRTSKPKKIKNNIKGGVILNDPNPNHKIMEYVDQLRGFANSLI